MVKQGHRAMNSHITDCPRCYSKMDTWAKWLIVGKDKTAQKKTQNLQTQRQSVHICNASIHCLFTVFHVCYETNSQLWYHKKENTALG